MNDVILWVEKYRPSKISECILTDDLKKTFQTFVDEGYIPNLLLSGGPGVGKTTVAKAMLEELGSTYMMINGSEESGIDVLRNKIKNFASTVSMDGNRKFVILDEVDYMTTNAQIALRYLLTSYTDNNVRFCLICNYVSRIDESLQTEFVRMRFNQLPESDILAFLRKIRDNEGLKLSDTNLVAIQRQFHSDIRSMINYIQTNQDNLQELHVITNAVWEKMVDLFRDPVCDIPAITLYFREIGARYYIDPRTIIKQFLYYIVRYRSSEMVSAELLNSIEHIIHLNHIRNEYIIHYFILKFRVYWAAPAAAAAPKKRIIKVKKQQSI